MGGHAASNKRPLAAGAGSTAAAASSSSHSSKLLVALLLLVGVAASPARAAFVPSVFSTTPRRAATLGMRARGEPDSTSTDPTPDPAAASSSPLLVSRGDWMQGLAGAAGVGAVALGGQRAVRAAQEERAVLVRRPVFSERLFDTRRRSYLPVDPYLLKSNKALDRPVVCVGEVHDDDSHHFAEYTILKVSQVIERRLVSIESTTPQFTQPQTSSINH